MRHDDMWHVVQRIESVEVAATNGPRDHSALKPIATPDIPRVITDQRVKQRRDVARRQRS